MMRARYVPPAEDRYESYACPFCNRVLPVDSDGVIVHDNVPHPDDWAPESEEDRRQ